MGLDLRLLPQYAKDADFSHDVISLDRDEDFFEEIRKCEANYGREVQRKGISSFLAFGRSGGYRYCRISKTPYGKIINGVPAKNLKEVFRNSANIKGWKNKAIKAFINKLPNDLEIWLFWH